MPIPRTNEYGLLPPGIHPCTLSEAESFFCWNDHRRALWLKFQHVMDEFRAFGFHHPLFLDGSFVTDKEIPGDVEVIMDVAHVDDYAAGLVVLFCFRHHDRLHAEWAVDLYPNIKGENDFSLYFQYVGEKTAAMKAINPKDKKGILRIENW